MPNNRPCGIRSSYRQQVYRATTRISLQYDMELYDKAVLKPVGLVVMTRPRFEQQAYLSIMAGRGHMATTSTLA